MAGFAEGVACVTARPDPSYVVRMLPEGAFEKRADAALVFDD